jgi:hypothetical protein
VHWVALQPAGGRPTDVRNVGAIWGAGKNHAQNTASVSTLLNTACRTGRVHEDRGAERLGPGTRRPRGLHRPRAETRWVREPPLDHSFRLAHGTPHRRDAANRTAVRPLQDLRPRRAARIGRSQLPRPRRPVYALLEKYAQDIFDTEPPPASASDDEFRAWRANVRERATTLIGEVRGDDEPDRKQIARQLADLSDRERVWGRDAGIKAGGRKRPRMTPAPGGR